MGRKSKEITLDEFFSKLCSIYKQETKNDEDTVKQFDLKDSKVLYAIGKKIIENKTVQKDLSKIIVSDENFTDSQGDFDCDDIVFGPQYLEYPSGKKLPVLICAMGGDWEIPVVFILYFDHNSKLRAYIPEDGNFYCKKYKCAYGSVGEYVDLKPEDEELDDEEFVRLYEGEVDEGTQRYSFDKLKEDIRARIEL